MTRLRLADLDRALDEVELPDGTVTKVRRLDGFMAHLWHEYNSTPKDERDPYILWEIGARCLPEVKQEDVDGLTAADIAAIIAVASGNVDQVLATLKNGNGPEVETSNISRPVTPSAPSSVPLPELPDVPPASSP